MMMVIINNKYLTLENNQLWKSNRYVEDVQKQKLIQRFLEFYSLILLNKILSTVYFLKILH